MRIDQEVACCQPKWMTTTTGRTRSVAGFAACRLILSLPWWLMMASCCCWMIVVEMRKKKEEEELVLAQMPSRSG